MMEDDHYLFLAGALHGGEDGGAHEGHPQLLRGHVGVERIRPRGAGAKTGAAGAGTGAGAGARKGAG